MHWALDIGIVGTHKYEAKFKVLIVCVREKSAALNVWLRLVSCKFAVREMKFACVDKASKHKQTRAKSKGPRELTKTHLSKASNLNLACFSPAKGRLTEL